MNLRAVPAKGAAFEFLRKIKMHALFRRVFSFELLSSGN
jgi:hypothetical protein